MRKQSLPTYPLLAVLGALCCPEPAGAQQQVFHYADPTPHRFAYSVAVLDDLDGDGTPEIGIGSWGDGPFIISGMTGTVLYHSTVGSDVEAYGVSIDGLPDITGDGIAEYLIGSRESLGSTPLHEVRSGADGSLVRSHAFSGFEITQHDDLDGDGWADYALVDERTMQIRSGVSGAVLSEWTIPPGHGDRLNRVARTGDVNGDGIPDVVGGQWDWTQGGGVGPGRVHMFSGAGGSRLWTVLGDDIPDFLGMDVTGDIDVNTDGTPDVVAITGPWGHAVEYVRVLSGQDGSLLRDEYLPPALQTDLFWRYAVVTLQDLDGDGIAEYAIGGADNSCDGVVELRSGASGAQLLQLTGSSGFGTSLDGSRDWDGDGLADLAVGAVDCSHYGGEVFVYSFADLFDCNGNGIPDGADLASGASQDCNLNQIPDECDVAGGISLDCNDNGIPDECDPDLNGNGIPDDCECFATNYCTANDNTTGEPAIIGMAGIPSISLNDFHLRAGPLPPNDFGLFFFGPYDRDPWPHGSGYLCIAAAGMERLNPPDLSNAAGFVVRQFDFTDVPGDPIQPGDTRYFQYWYRDHPAVGDPWNFTDGLEVVFCP